MNTSLKQAEDEIAVLRWILGALEIVKYSDDEKSRSTFRQLLTKLDLSVFRRERGISGARFRTLLNWFSDYGLSWSKAPHTVNSITIGIEETDYDQLKNKYLRMLRHESDSDNKKVGRLKTDTLSYKGVTLVLIGQYWQVMFRGQQSKWHKKSKHSKLLIGLMKSQYGQLEYKAVLKLIDEKGAARNINSSSAEKRSSAQYTLKLSLDNLKRKLKEVGMIKPGQFIYRENGSVNLN